MNMRDREYNWKLYSQKYADDIRNFWSYQDSMCASLSDQEIIMGMILAYTYEACRNSAAHNTFDPNHLPNDEYR